MSFSDFPQEQLWLGKKQDSDGCPLWTPSALALPDGHYEFSCSYEVFNQETELSITDHRQNSEKADGPRKGNV